MENMNIYDINGNKLNFINLIHEFIESKGEEHGIDGDDIYITLCDDIWSKNGVSKNIELMTHNEDIYDGCVFNSIEIINCDSEPEEEQNVPVLFFTIKNDIGWGKWCDITGGNHYALNEGYSPSLNEVFYCTKSQAEQLGII